MKLYIHDKAAQDISKPWGGGNVVLNSIQRAALEDPDIELVDDYRKGDVIYVHDIRHASFLLAAAQKFNLKIILRVGDLGKHGKPEIMELIKEGIHIPARVIVPSDWAYREIMKLSLIPSTKMRVLKNEPDLDFFKPEPVKLVTHHWSNNPMKGAKQYLELQEKIEEWDFEFHFIGRPCFVTNGKVILHGPKEKHQIADLLRCMDFYLTSSVGETGPNHVIEARACNLPIVVWNECRECGVTEYAEPAMIRVHSLEELQPILDRNRFIGVKELAQCYLEEFKSVSTIYARGQDTTSST